MDDISCNLCYSDIMKEPGETKPPGFFYAWMSPVGSGMLPVGLFWWRIWCQQNLKFPASIQGVRTSYRSERNTVMITNRCIRKRYDLAHPVVMEDSGRRPGNNIWKSILFVWSVWSRGSTWGQLMLTTSFPTEEILICSGIRATGSRSATAIIHRRHDGRIRFRSTDFKMHSVCLGSMGTFPAERKT